MMVMMMMIMMIMMAMINDGGVDDGDDGNGDSDWIIPLFQNLTPSAAPGQPVHFFDIFTSPKVSMEAMVMMLKMMTTVTRDMLITSTPWQRYCTVTSGRLVASSHLHIFIIFTSSHLAGQHEVDDVDGWCWDAEMLMTMMALKVLMMMMMAMMMIASMALRMIVTTAMAIVTVLSLFSRRWPGSTWTGASDGSVPRTCLSPRWGESPTRGKDLALCGEEEAPPPPPSPPPPWLPSENS